MTFPLQRNEPVTFFDGRSAIGAKFIRTKGKDAEIRIVQSSSFAYPEGDVVVVPLENLTTDYILGADDASLDLQN